MVVIPAETPVTDPLESTVATEGLLDDQVNVWLLSVPEKATAHNCSVVKLLDVPTSTDFVLVVTISFDDVSYKYAPEGGAEILVNSHLQFTDAE
jgi:hypothetical protein